jgi:hypothetical protein
MNSDHPVIVCAPLSLSVHFGTLVIGRHRHSTPGIDKAMQVEAASSEYSMTGVSRFGKRAEGVHYDIPYACTLGSMMGTYGGSRGSY